MGSTSRRHDTRGKTTLVLFFALVLWSPIHANADVVRAHFQPAVSDEVSVSKAEAGSAGQDVLVVIPRGHVVERLLVHGAEGRSDAILNAIWSWHGYQVAALRVRTQARGALELELHTRPGGDLPRTRERQNRALDAHHASIVRSNVLNPERVAGYAPPSGRAVPAPGPFRPAAFPDLEGSDVEYVIVTSEALASSFQALADWKTRRGVPTIVRTIESIEAAYRHGADVQETIRTFLQDAYQKWSLRWVLLGGDTDIIPARYLVSSHLHSAPVAIPSDLYFAGLDGNWNADGDALWGEAPTSGAEPDPDGGDLMAELHVSRAPVLTPSQVDVFIQKVIDYETPTDPTYQNRALFLSEVLSPANWDGSPESIMLDGSQFAEDLINQYVPAGVTKQRMYENYTPFAGSVPLSHEASLAEINSGYNLVNHIGHGFRYNMSVGDQSIVNADADALVNTYRYSILNIVNCTSMAFDFPCLGEHYMNNPVGGAVAVLGASRSAFALVSKSYQDDFYELLYDQGLWQVGELFTRSRDSQTANAALEGAHRWTHYIYNMLGDPEMAVFSTTPIDLVVQHPTSAVLGEQALLVTVLDSALDPIVGARVCLQKDADDYEVGTTDASGNVTLDFTAESSGDIQVAVSGRNLTTYLGVVSVSTGGAAYLHVESISIDDDAVAGTVGNNNGILDAGETVDLLPTLRNDGGSSSAPVLGNLTLNDPYVSIETSAFSAGILAQGQSASAAAPVRITMLPGTPDGHTFEMLFSMAYGSDASEDRVRRAVHAPRLELVRLEVLDQVTGNGNGQPDAGEIFDLRAWVKNYGSGRADGVLADLQTTNPNVDILQGASSYGILLPLGEVSNGVLFQLRENILDENIIELHLTDSHGRLVIEPFELRRPEPPLALVLDPTSGPTIVLATWTPATEPDVGGYHLYRSTDPGGPWTRVTVDATQVSYYRDTGLGSSMRYYYYVTTVDSSGNESAASAIETVATNPPQASGWPISMGSDTSSSPALGDLDGDGLLEIVQGNDHVYAWHADGSEILDADNDAQTWGVFNALTTATTASVALAEFDGTAGLEVFSCNWSNNSVFAIDGDGLLLWTQAPSNGGTAGYWGTPAVADMNGDGRSDVFAASKDGHLYAWKHDGSPLLAANPDGHFALYAPWSRSSPAIGNLDGDPELEIVLTDAAGQLFAWNSDGSSLPGFPLTFAAYFNSPVLGDVDGDGALEIVTVSEGSSGNVHCMRANGTELSGFPQSVPMASANVSPTPALADLDGDGLLEIVVGSNASPASASQLYVFRADGSLYPGWPQPTGSDSESSPLVADLNGDASPDIVFGGQGGLLHGWNQDGTQLQGFPLSVGDFIRASPAVGDLDQDGDPELVLVAWDGQLYVWDLAFAYDPAHTHWGSFLHDSQRVARYGHQVGDATGLSEGQELAAPRRLDLAQNVPNPFNPSTHISFAVPTGGRRVLLRIFDVRGRLVRTLLEATRAAGSHRVLWDGRDDVGRAAPSGLYFYQLQWGDEARARRMLLVR